MSLYLCLCVSASDATIHFIVQCNPQSQYAFHYIVKRTTSRRGLRTSSISNCRLGEDGLGRSGRGKLQRAATVSYQATNGQSTRRKSKVFILLLACVCVCEGGGILNSLFVWIHPIYLRWKSKKQWHLHVKSATENTTRSYSSKILKYADHIFQPKLLPCGHTFCHRCLEKFVNPKLLVECPNCRKVFSFQISSSLKWINIYWVMFPT